MGVSDFIHIKVCYALSHHQEMVSLELPASSNVLDAINCSEILEIYPEIDLSKNSIGIFGKIVDLDHVLADKDRVEIYRPLLIDPMEARRQRAELEK